MSEGAGFSNGASCHSGIISFRSFDEQIMLIRGATTLTHWSIHHGGNMHHAQKGQKKSKDETKKEQRKKQTIQIKKVLATITVQNTEQTKKRKMIQLA